LFENGELHPRSRNFCRDTLWLLVAYRLSDLPSESFRTKANGIPKINGRKKPLECVGQIAQKWNNTEAQLWKVNVTPAIFLFRYSWNSMEVRVTCQCHMSQGVYAFVT
jgi:hypothetical protein